MYPINVSFKDILRIGTADSSFSLICTGLVHDYVHVYLQVFVHSFLSFTTPQFLSNTGPWTCLGHQSAVPFEHGSMDLPRSPVRSSFRTRVHAPVSFPASSVFHRFSSPHFLSLMGPRTCLVHRFPLPPSFIRSHISRCSSVPSRCTMCVGGAVCNDLVNQLHYTAISDIICLLLPVTWVALLYG